MPYIRYVVIPSFELYIRDPPPPINFVFTHIPSIQNFKVVYMQVLLVIFSLSHVGISTFFFNFSNTVLHEENFLHINRGLINY